MGADGPVVGFDLDMTLIDSRPGIIETIRVFSDELGLGLDPDATLDVLLRSTITVVFRDWYGDEGDALADRFREIYAEHGPVGSTLLPGAADAVHAVRSVGGRAVVVTAKFEPNAHRCLNRVGLEVDAVFGDLLGAQKATALEDEGASVYVGDTLGDVEAARVAGATSVMVATGPLRAQELSDAGAEVVLPDLTHFPRWWHRHRARDVD